MQIMECSLCDVDYMNYSLDEAFSVCKDLIQETCKYNGELVLLFHNSAFAENEVYKILYEKLLNYLKNKQIRYNLYYEKICNYTSYNRRSLCI